MIDDFTVCVQCGGVFHAPTAEIADALLNASQAECRDWHAAAYDASLDPCSPDFDIAAWVAK